MEQLFAVLIVVVAGIMAGLFTFPMTSMILGKSQWGLEHTWLIYALFGNFIWPWLLAGLTCPSLSSVLADTNASGLMEMFGYGIAWGAGAPYPPGTCGKLVSATLPVYWTTNLPLTTSSWLRSQLVNVADRS